MDIESIKKVSLNPGDVLVVQLDYVASPEIVHGIIETLRKVFPDNKAIVVDKDVELSVVSQEEADTFCRCFGPPEPTCPLHGDKG